jgi:hypothetical protein
MGAGAKLYNYMLLQSTSYIIKISRIPSFVRKPVLIYEFASDYSKLPYISTVIRFVSISAKFRICTIVGLNGTIADAKIFTLDT